MDPGVIVHVLFHPCANHFDKRVYQYTNMLTSMPIIRGMPELVFSQPGFTLRIRPINDLTL